MSRNRVQEALAFSREGIPVTTARYAHEAGSRDRAGETSTIQNGTISSASPWMTRVGPRRRPRAQRGSPEHDLVGTDSARAQHVERALCVCVDALFRRVALAANAVATIFDEENAHPSRVQRPREVRDVVHRPRLLWK